MTQKYIILSYLNFNREMGKTAIIILNYNNYEDTINCIESIEKYNTADIKYVIVDNNSNREGCKKN